MKLITAVLPASGFERVHEALRTLGIPGVTVTTVFARGVGPAHDEVYRGTRRRVELQPAVRLDLVTPDADAPDIVHVIAVAGVRGSIWVTPVERVVRIRTREWGETAL
ncbi:P-II family nitrogen regulator [Streptacidiphilus jiangxiensis]|uniref:Nitrogen regulatory protein P-II 1/nitrogen regulatory protein P-II 2 n=1 Tax=Streptacidiphilus jiangxiensis TaxID=235985 RepID=A0A1H7X2X3_STRJI|nr:P-II family nitrogen regulator [Streptacidiphilus jiangxiensis]SEM27991.1 nitrogen regulatory protein P-II 1/nitrogen regulatory protein P-II 2 [Streptacidiphilus jiangxiensis]